MINFQIVRNTYKKEWVLVNLDEMKWVFRVYSITDIKRIQDFLKGLKYGKVDYCLAKDIIVDETNKLFKICDFYKV